MNSSNKEFISLNNAELKFLERLAETDPSSPALLNLARAYITQGRLDAAVTVAKTVFDAHPDNLEAALLTAKAMIKLKQDEQAKTILKRLSSRLTDLGSIFKELAGLFEIIGETSQALKFLKAYKALSLYESETEDAEYLLFELNSEARDQGARTEPVPTETLAGLYLEQGLVDKAIEIYEKILEQDPGNERIRNKMIELYLGTDEQLPDFEPSTPAQSKEREPKKLLIQKLEKIRLAARRRQEAIEARI